MAITEGIQNGSDIIVFANGQAIVCGTVSNFDTDHDTRDTSCKDSKHKAVREGRLSWGGSADVLFARIIVFRYRRL